ncbi:hypothetical protein CHARACLAT_030555 [Characodon lateralis]|uniref:Uncharacterized protein n=1 Tax=Characodon lateralis TaxID=208331 RepID=A0ABU7DBB3_9TELE|nr:hypothetical protein [Characodon lateralis]
MNLGQCGVISHPWPSCLQLGCVPVYFSLLQLLALFLAPYTETQQQQARVFRFTTRPQLEPPQPPSCDPLSSIPGLQTSLLIIKQRCGAKTEGHIVQKQQAGDMHE